MPHVLSLFDSQFLHSYDLPKPEVAVEIEAVTAGELTGQGGRKTKRPLVKFSGAERSLVLNKTNAKTLMTLFGPDTAAWTGKKVVLYKAQTQLGGDTVECIRIKAAK